MVPSDDRNRASSPSSTPEKTSTSPQILEEVPATDEIMKLAAPELDIADDKEVVLREVEDELLPAADDKEASVFSSIVAISSTADH